MKRNTIIILSLATATTIMLAVATKVLAQNTITGSEKSTAEYELDWEDEFNGRSLDLTHWQRITRGESAWRRYMSTNDRLFRLRKGYLRLYARRNKGIDKKDTASVLTGGISTRDRYHIQGYGKLEVRARIHGAQGCWPAIWTTSVKQTNNTGWAEIDLMEHYNHDNLVVQTAHNNYATYQKKQKESEHSARPTVNAKDWNVYSVEILPDRLIYAINGETTYVYHNIESTGARHQFTYGTESYIRIDMQWLNPWLKGDVSELPAWMDIDWVRYSKLVKK